MNSKVTGTLWVLATLIGIVCVTCGVLAVFGYAVDSATSQLAP